MNEVSGQEGKSVGSDCSWSMSSGGFQAQRGGRDSTPCPGTPPDPCFWWLRQRRAPVAPPSCSQKLGWGLVGVSPPPLREPHWPGLVSPTRTARRVAEPSGHLEPCSFPRPAFHPLPSSSLGAVATPAPGLAGGGVPSVAYIPSREAGSRPSVSS